MVKNRSLLNMRNTRDTGLDLPGRYPTKGELENPLLDRSQEGLGIEHRKTHK